MKKLLSLILLAGMVHLLAAQPANTDSSKYPRQVAFTARQYQSNMMEQLGLKELRPGPSGNESAPNHANCPKEYPG